MINSNYKVVISPPFSRYINFRKTIPILGSYTLKQRKGAIFQFIKTFRPYKGGYINKIGLRNPGIDSLERFNFDYFNNKAISIAVINGEEWSKLSEKIFCLRKLGFNPLMIEINLSCPNVNYKYNDISTILSQIKSYENNINYGVKLAPTIASIDVIKVCLDYNIINIHLSNTIPSSKGGISGPLLRDKSLSIIEKVKSEFKNNISIIGGGGIYSKEDILSYKNVGANYFSLSTGLIKHPFKIKKMINYANSL